MARSVAAGAVPALDGQCAAGQSRILLAHPPAGGAAHLSKAAGHAATGVHGVHHRGADRRAGRDHRRGVSQWDLGLRCQRGGPRGAFHAELLAWHHDDPADLGRVGLAAAVGLRAADRGLAAVARHYHYARVRAGQRDRGDPDAAHAERDADIAGSGLCADGARERAARVRRGDPARAAQRADPGGNAGCAGAWHAVFGRGADRAGVQHSRLWQDGGRCGVQPRLSGCAGGRAGDCVPLRDAEPVGRCAVRGDQSKAEGAHP
jgi:hypothetical protein